MVLELKNFCCCVDLRTGSFIVGYLGLVGSIILTLLLLIQIIITGETLYMKLQEEYVPDIGWRIVAVSLSTTVMALVAISLIFTILLLIGLHKYKRDYVRAYLIYTTIFLVISLIMLIASIINGSPVHDIIRDLVILGGGVYFLLVIRSYYLKMGVKHTVAPNGA